MTASIGTSVERAGPRLLDGLKVIDLSWGIAGPMTTMILADQGARVTRIERPGGDPFRMQSGYRVWHRGKRSAVIDLKSAGGRDRLLALAARADVVVDSFAPGTADRLGIGWDVLNDANPRLIGCSITGYGTTRHRDRPALDALVQARTGLMFDQRGRRGGPMAYISGFVPRADLDAPDGMIRGADRDGPVFPRSNWPSLGAAYNASLGIAAALLARERTGFHQVHPSRHCRQRRAQLMRKRARGVILPCLHHAVSRCERQHGERRERRRPSRTRRRAV